MNIRRNKLGVVIVHEGTYVLSATDHTAICRGHDTSAITTVSGQQVFAAAIGSIAVAEAAGSRSYATVKGAVARAIGKDTLAIAMANGSKAYSHNKGAHAVATILGAQAFIDRRAGPTLATCSEDLLQCAYPGHQTPLRLNVL